MSEPGPEFVSRDDASLATRLDRRVDRLAGYRYQNFAAAANLRMTADLDAFDTWRATAPRPLSLTAALAAATAAALTRQPLFAAQFDGCDLLLTPAQPSLGITVDTGDHARCLVFERAGALAPADLASRIDLAFAELAPRRAHRFTAAPTGETSAWRRRRRWLRMFVQETRERFDYLLPMAQQARFAAQARAEGHLQIHNLGPMWVQDFKGFLRRPAVAAIWALTAEKQVQRDGAGGWIAPRRLPLMLVYAQELFPVDQACAFLGDVIAGLEQPARLWAVRP